MNSLLFQTTQIDQLISHLRTKQNPIIGVDGESGVGKTTISYKIAYELLGRAIDFDDHLKGNENNAYSQRIDVEQINSIISVYKNRGAIILSGICLLEVTKRLNIELDFLIHYKKVSGLGIWHLSTYFDEYATADSVNILSKLNKEIVAYHKEFLPHEKANFILVRRE